jgi:hypothetical protein
MGLLCWASVRVGRGACSTLFAFFNLLSYTPLPRSSATPITAAPRPQVHVATLNATTSRASLRSALSRSALSRSAWRSALSRSAWRSARSRSSMNASDSCCCGSPVRCRHARYRYYALYRWPAAGCRDIRLYDYMSSTTKSIRRSEKVTNAQVSQWFRQHTLATPSPRISHGLLHFS